MNSVSMQEENQTLQEYVFDIREKIPDGIYKILMEKYCYPPNQEYNNNQNPHYDELKECKEYIDLLMHEIEILNQDRDAMWKAGYDQRQNYELNKKMEESRVKYKRRKELEQMSPEERKLDIQLKKIDKKIETEHKNIEKEEMEINFLKSKSIGIANKIAMSNILNNLYQTDSFEESLQLYNFETEIKKKKDKIAKSNKNIVELLHKKTQLQIGL